MPKKYLRRLRNLYERMDEWRSIGPACSEYEWTKMEQARDDIDELIRLVLANDNYIIPGYRLKAANKYWKRYSVKNIETVKIAAGEVADIFKKNKEKRQ